jgi:hypothetical protein
MMKSLRRYDPLRWFWLADDGRLFSSEQQAIVSDADPAYVDWLRLNEYPTPWPKDAAGNQTIEALNAVLEPYGKRCE